MKNILLLGAAGKTGISYSRLLLKEGYHVFAWDDNKNIIYPDDVGFHKHFIKVEEGNFKNETILDQIDSVTLSPGVPLNQKIIIKAKAEKKKIFSEIDFCIPYLKAKRWIGVTGTDGKSTVVTLVNHLLRAFGQNTILCGNIGVPFSKVVLESDYKSSEILIAELSSYQLELAEALILDVAVLLNIAIDHLNRYKNYDNYASTKCGIMKKVKNKGTCLTSKSLYERYFKNNDYAFKVNMVQIHELSSPHFYWQKKNNNTYILHHYKLKEGIISSDLIKLKGKHNLNNILFSLEIIYVIIRKNIDIILEKNIFLKTALQNFISLSHRFEIIQGRYPKIIYINDSKATTSQAVYNAVQNVPTNSYLFLGGRGKGENYRVLAENIRIKKMRLILFGEERKQLERVFCKAGNIIIGVFEKLEEAVEVAHQDYKKNTFDKIAFLLSPGCTSWDAYSSFEERGDHFKSLVR